MRRAAFTRASATGCGWSSRGLAPTRPSWSPPPIPVLQAAQLLGVPPSACAVVASAPADIRSARLAGARAVGYARDPAARQRLTAAGAEAATASITGLAGSAYLASARRRAARQQAIARW